MKPVGKLHPIILTIENNKVVDDIIEIIKYKMQLK
jgi:hypothetical protein